MKNKLIKNLICDQMLDGQFEHIFFRAEKIWSSVSVEIMGPVWIDDIKCQIRDQLTYQLIDQKLHRMWDQTSGIGSGRPRTQMGAEWGLK